MDCALRNRSHWRAPLPNRVRSLACEGNDLVGRGGFGDAFAVWPSDGDDNLRVFGQLSETEMEQRVGLLSHGGIARVIEPRLAEAVGLRCHDSADGSAA